MNLSLLPYELQLEVWLYCHYNEVRVLSALARASSNPELATMKDIADDPFSWARRARERGMKLMPKDIRSSICQMIPLDQRSPGLKAQSRYVEIASCWGVTPDSHVLLSGVEILRRAIIADHRPLFDAHKHLINQKNEHQLRPIVTEVGTNNSKIADEFRALCCEHGCFTNIYPSLSYRRGFHKEEHDESVNLDYVVGLIDGDHSKEADRWLPFITDSPNFLHEIALAWIRAGDGRAKIYLVGRPDLFWQSAVLNALTRTRRPELFEELFPIIISQPDFDVNNYMSLLTEIGLTGSRPRVISTFHNVVRKNGFSVTIRFNTGKIVPYLHGSQGFHLLETLLNLGVTPRVIRQAYSKVSYQAEWACKAVELWVKNE